MFFLVLGSVPRFQKRRDMCAASVLNTNSLSSLTKIVLLEPKCITRIKNNCQKHCMVEQIAKVIITVETHKFSKLSHFSQPKCPEAKRVCNGCFVAKTAWKLKQIFGKCWNKTFMAQSGSDLHPGAHEVLVFYATLNMRDMRDFHQCVRVVKHLWKHTSNEEHPQTTKCFFQKRHKPYCSRSLKQQNIPNRNSSSRDM